MIFIETSIFTKLLPRYLSDDEYRSDQEISELLSLEMCLNEQLLYSTLRGHKHQRKHYKTTHVVPTTLALL